MQPGIEVLVQNSDPANVALLAVMWWRLDRRIRTLRTDLAQNRSESA